jgi:hypothetical protein
MRLEVPADLADELIADGTAVRSYTTRGPGMSDAVQLAIQFVNAGADMITVATAAAATPAVVRRLWQYVRHKRGEDTDPSFEIVLRSNGRDTAVELSISLPDEDAERILMAGIAEARAKRHD